jgi:hypothetical protein
MAASYQPPKLVAEIMAKWEECQQHHGAFVRAYERRERSYKGILSRNSEAAKWRHQMHPPLAFNLIETVVSNTVEMGLEFDVRPSPKINMSFEEATAAIDQADAIGDLLAHEHRVDEMEYKQRPLFLCSAIGGVGIGKSYWNYSTGPIRKQGVKLEAVGTEDAQLYVPVIQEIEEDGVLRDHSTFEVIDPRDFVMNESAKSVQPFDPGGAQYVFHRCWYSFEQLKMMEAAGDVKNVDALLESRDQQGEYTDRGSAVFDINRAKGLIEVLEYWCFDDGRVQRALVGNRNVLLRDKEASPFWHEGYPFVLSSSMPQPFSPYGMSDMELIEQLQEMLWEVMNQRFDNIELVNNAIMLIRSDVDDPDAFEHYPGARWPVEDPSQVEALRPDYQLIEATTSVEALLRGDIQNVTSAGLLAGGTESATVDQKTATGASLVMSAAQQRLSAKKYQGQQGLRQEAAMRLKNCQQFITDNRLVHILGEDGRLKFRDISPLDIQGDFVVEMEALGESQIREQRRAEALQFSQFLLQNAPLLAASGNPLNTREVVAWYAKRWDVRDWERFFSQQPQSAGAVAGNMGGATPGQSAPPGGPNMGITAGTAVDAASPSATGGNSMSPEAAMARALSMSGGMQGGLANAQRG